MFGLANAIRRMSTITDKSQLKSALLVAMKTGDKTRASVIKAMLSEVTYAEKSNGSTGVSVVQIIQKGIQRRKESADAYLKGGRKDLMTVEQNEMQILQQFLPKQLSESEIESLVREAQKRLGITDMKGIGLLMKEIDASVAPRKSVSDVFKRILSTNQ